MSADPDILIDLTTARTDFEANIIVEALEGRGIPARAFTTAGSMLQWEAAVSQPMRIAVRRRDLDAARAALQSIKIEADAIDWDSVDVDAQAIGGAPMPRPQGAARSGEQREACPMCGYAVRAAARPALCPGCGADLRTERSPEDAAGRIAAWVIAAMVVLLSLLTVWLLGG